MGFQVSPGVRVVERDLTAIIPAVATTPAAMAGQFRWGPVNQRIIVSTENDLYQLFGAPDNNTYQYFFSAANFLQYGNNIQVVRGTSGAYNAVANSSVGTQSTGVQVQNEDSYESTYYNGGSLNGSGINAAKFAAKYMGAFGNSIRIEVCDSVTGFNSWSLSGQFSNAPGTSLYVENATGLTVANDELHIAILDEDGMFSGVTGAILEKYEGLSKATDARKSEGTSNYYVNVLNRDSAYIWVLNHINGINVGVSTDQPNYGSIGPTAGPISGSTGGLFISSMTGGNNGSNLSDDQVAALYETFYADADNVDIGLLIAGPVGLNTTSAAARITEVAKARKDCVAFVSAGNDDPMDTDATKSTNCQTMKTAVGNNSYGFIDTGWKMMYDRYNDVNRWVPLNPDVAGLCARTDETNDPWWSPAGFNRGNIRGVIKLAFNPNQAYRDTLYPKGINPIVTFPGEGTILYGDRTAQTKPSAFDRINVRRLFIVLEKAISIASKYQLFEFNDNFTRSMFVSMVQPFLRDVQARRGILDFKVICDNTNNTAEIIDSNRFVADIYIKPARSINYIQLNFIATRSGVNFEEIAALTMPGR